MVRCKVLTPPVDREGRNPLLMVPASSGEYIPNRRCQSGMPDQEAKGSYLDRFESLPGRPMPGPDLSVNEVVGFLPAHPKLRMSSDFIFDAKIELFTRLGDSRQTAAPFPG